MLALAGASAIAGLSMTRSASATTFIYTPTTAATDVWSAGTDWSAVPTSGTATELTFVGTNTTVQPNTLANTNSDDIAGLFQLNILDLQGTDPASGAGTININSSGTSTGLNLISNGATTPVINLNALAGTAGLTYNVNAPLTLSNNTLITGNGTATFLFAGGISGSGLTLTKTGSSSFRLNGNTTLGSLITSGGTGSLSLVVSGSAAAATGTITVQNTAAIGNGSGTLQIGQAGSSGTASGILDLSSTTSATINMPTINIAANANSGGLGGGTLKLPTNSTITAGTVFNVATSTGAQNGVNNVFVGFLTTAAGAGTNTINTASFFVDNSKSSGLVTVGAGNTLALTGVSGGRAAMNVGIASAGGGSGNYMGMFDGSAGVFAGNLSSLNIGGVTDSTASSTTNGIVKLSNSAANVLNISGPGVGGGGGTGTVSIGRIDNTGTTGVGNGLLIINGLNSTSAITNTTSNGNAILIGGSVSTRVAKGTLDLNGGSVTITTAGTAGAAIAGGTASASNSNVNFNGTTIVAGSSSTNWIKTLTKANVGAGGAIFDTNGNNVTISQPLIHSVVGTVTGITMTSNGSGYSTAAPSNVPLVTFGEVGNASAYGIGQPVISGGQVTGVNILAAENFTTTPTVTFTGGVGSGVAATASFTAAAATDGGLTKNGQGTLTLSGANTYNGPTTINNGMLSLTGTLTSNISVNSGGALGGEGSTTGSLTFSSSGGTGFSFDPSTGGAFTANTITATGATITLTPTAAPSGTGIVVMNATSGITASPSNFIINARGTINVTATQVLFNTGTAATLTWKGNATNPTFWDNGTTVNWDNGGTPDKFFAGDNVTFDDSASSFVVTPQGAVGPGSVLFNNSANDYTLNGNGSIGGTIGITKSGTAKLTVANNNTYSGGTTISAGTVQLGDGINGNGTLGTGAITNNGALITSYGTNNVIIANAIGGSGTLTQAGTGTVTRAATSTYGGGTTINAGATLHVGNGGTSGSLGTGAVANAGTLTFNRTDGLALSAAITGAGTVNAIGGAGANVTLSLANSMGTLNVGLNATGGSVVVPAAASLLVGNAGVGTISVGNATGATVSAGTLDLSAATGFTANVSTINVGTTSGASRLAPVR